MQALLRLFLSFVLLTTGASLQCEVCYSIGNSCTGNMQTCPSGQDICAVAFSESTLDGQRILTTEKGCENSEICTSSLVELYLGQGKSYRARLYCCTGDTCGNVSPELPPEQVTPNGLQCPGCYSWTETCSLEMVNCTGWDTYCFGVLSRTYTNGFHVDSIIKGCTTKSVCESLLHGKSPFFGSANTIINAECSSDVSRGCRITISLLPSFSGLLLLQVLL